MRPSLMYFRSVFGRKSAVLAVNSASDHVLPGCKKVRSGEIVRKTGPMTRNGGFLYVELTLILRGERASSEKIENGPSGVFAG